jgi:hypothetical protein
LEAIYQRWKSQAEFVRVYVREAHPIDGWRTPANDRAGILVKQPLTLAERCAVAERCVEALDLESTMVVDEIDNRVGEAYDAMPDRLYLIDRDGRVAYRGGPGPFAFNPGEMEQSLLLLLLDQPSVDSQAQERPIRSPNSQLPQTPK